MLIQTSILISNFNPSSNITYSISNLSAFLPNLSLHLYSSSHVFSFNLQSPISILIVTLTPHHHFNLKSLHSHYPYFFYFSAIGIFQILSSIDEDETSYHLTTVVIIVYKKCERILALDFKNPTVVKNPTIFGEFIFDYLICTVV